MAKTTGLNVNVNATDINWGELLKNYKASWANSTATASGSNLYWDNTGMISTSSPFTAPSVAPLPPGFTWPPPPDPYPHVQDYEISILKPTDDVPFRQIRLETPFGEVGVLWFDGESLPDALERLAAEVRAALHPF